MEKLIIRRWATFSISFLPQNYLLPALGGVAGRELQTQDGDEFHQNRSRLNKTTIRNCNPGEARLLTATHTVGHNWFYMQASTKNSISDSEKREKKILEKKLAEMEDELKVRDFFLILLPYYKAELLISIFKELSKTSYIRHTINNRNKILSHGDIWYNFKLIKCYTDFLLSGTSSETRLSDLSSPQSFISIFILSYHAKLKFSSLISREISLKLENFNR